METAIKHIDRKKNDFGHKWRLFFENKFKVNRDSYPRVEWEWQKYAGAKRQYYTVEDYKVVTCRDMGKLPQNLD